MGTSEGLYLQFPGGTTRERVCFNEAKCLVSNGALGALSKRKPLMEVILKSGRLKATGSEMLVFIRQCGISVIWRNACISYETFLLLNKSKKK